MRGFEFGASLPWSLGFPQSGTSAQCIAHFAKEHVGPGMTIARSKGVMKRPHLHLPKIDLHSIGVQTVLELAAGALAIALLYRWIAW